MCPEFSPPRSQPALLHQLEHVAVADLRAREPDAETPERALEREVGHQRADHAGDPPVLARARGGDHVEELIAVVRRARGVGHQQAVAVAVERDADVGAMLAHRSRQRRPDASRPTASLMLKPFGSSPIAVTSAPSSWKTCGATW